jgi:hypothetical protein
LIGSELRAFGFESDPAWATSYVPARAPSSP